MSSNNESVLDEFRLPGHIKPTSYDVVIAPNPKTDRFEGASSIELELSCESGFVQLNVKDLSILSAHIQNDSGTILYGAVSTNEELEIATISFDGKVAKGNWTLFLRFVGSINRKLKGIYKSSWLDNSGREEELVVTQFCATDARRVFPCFDEPEMKAEFRLSLIVDKDKTALSNSQIEFEQEIPNGGTVTHFHKPGLYSSFGPLYGKKRIQFKPTIKLSSYLVAFVVGNLVSKHESQVNGVDLRIWSTPGKEELTSFALKAAEFGLKWFEEYFQVKCPVDGKIDFVAVPDHAYSAMENLGCITFRESALLVDEKSASIAELKRVASTVIHEIAHMWFGDLVTMKWWNGIWLNEAFATFMQKLCTSAWKPDWGVFEDFSLSRSDAYNVDSLASTHPIESPVSHPDEASELFDVISYQKGCSVLYQIHEFIGAEVFRNGIRHYLKAHAFGNTETHDLWDSLELACSDQSIPVREIMDEWVFKPGHPIVRVSQSSGSSFIVLEQSLFSFHSNASSQLHPIPVIVRIIKSSGETTLKRLILKEARQLVYVGEDVELVVVNSEGSGFYRVVYENDLVEKMLDGGLDRLSVVERYNLVSDTFDAVKAGICPSGKYLSILDCFAYEDDPRVWSVIASSLQVLKEAVPEDSLVGYKRFVKQLIEPTVRRLGWEVVSGEIPSDLETRKYVLPLMVTICGDDTTVKQARCIYEEWKLSQRIIPAEILTAALKVLAFAGDRELYEEFSDHAFNSATPQDRDRFLYSLAYFQSQELAEETLAKIKSKQVRMGDTPTLLGLLMVNVTAQHETWSFLKENFDSIVLEYPEPAVIKIIRTVSRLGREDIALDVRDFFASKDVVSATLAIAQTVEQLMCNVALNKTEGPSLAKQLA